MATDHQVRIDGPTDVVDVTARWRTLDRSARSWNLTVVETGE